MATSVPQVRPIQEFKLRIANVLAGALQHYRDTQDVALLAQAVALAREAYESVLKEAGHRGNLDWQYLAQLGSGLDKVEAIVERIKARKPYTKEGN